MSAGAAATPGTSLLAAIPWRRPLFWVELFLAGNLGFLAVDIYLAHLTNDFAHATEWIPVAFSLVATPLLLLSSALGGATTGLEDDGPGRGRRRAFRALGLMIGWGSVAVGVAGLVFHLRAEFFSEQTLRSLVYTAPFAAPLAYAGLGLIVILNRMTDDRTLDWARWVVLLAAGGFAGNFVLSLADHAQNGFFYGAEWVGVVAGAVGVGVLVAVVAVPDDRPLIGLASVLMPAQALVGALGFWLHARANLSRSGGTVRDHFIFGAPVFAPLLFADLAVLALLGLWALVRHRSGSAGILARGETSHPVTG